MQGSYTDSAHMHPSLWTSGSVTSAVSSTAMARDGLAAASAHQMSCSACSCSTCSNSCFPCFTQCELLQLYRCTNFCCELQITTCSTWALRLHPPLDVTSLTQSRTEIAAGSFGPSLVLLRTILLHSIPQLTAPVYRLASQCVFPAR